MKQTNICTRKHLARAESKCRVKVIQEYHLNKEEQRIFDNAKVGMGLHYKTIYTDLRNGKDFAFMWEIKGRRISAAIAKGGSAFKEAATAFSTFSSAIDGFII